MFQIWIQILALKKKSAMILMYLVSFNIQMGCPLLEKLKIYAAGGTWFVYSTSSILKSVSRVNNSRSLSEVRQMLAPCGERG